MRDIRPTVFQILGDILGVPADVLSPTASVSSLKYQEMAAAAIACEKTFHIELEDERIPDLKTAGAWADYVKERIADRDDGRTIESSIRQTDLSLHGRPVLPSSLL